METLKIIKTRFALSKRIQKIVHLKKIFVRDLTVFHNVILPKIPVLNVTQANLDNLTISQNTRINTLEINGNITFQKCYIFSGVSDFSKIPNMQFIWDQILPVEWISFRNLGTSINITRTHPYHLFNTKIFTYKNPKNRFNQIYLINNSFTLFHFELFHRVYQNNLSPTIIQKYATKASVKLIFHNADGSGPTAMNQVLDEYILYDGNLTTYDGSTASFVSNFGLNERIRLLHIGNSEISTEILIKVTAIR